MEYHTTRKITWREMEQRRKQERIDLMCEIVAGLAFTVLMAALLAVYCLATMPVGGQ